MDLPPVDRQETILQRRRHASGFAAAVVELAGAGALYARTDFIIVRDGRIAALYLYVSSAKTSYSDCGMCYVGKMEG